jgi:two-component system nitrate/nitrite response regulator NarL
VGHETFDVGVGVPHVPQRRRGSRAEDTGVHGPVLIVDDHALVRHGLALAIGEFCEGARILEAGSLAEAIELARRTPELTVVLYDLHLADTEESGVVGLRQMIAEIGETPLMVFSGSAEPSAVIDCIRAGARGYLLKTCSIGALEHALSLVLSGETYVPLPRTILVSPGAAEETPPLNRMLDRLTGRQRDVFQLLLAGQSNKEIARSLGVLEGTVKVHVRAIMQKLGVRNRTQVAVAAARAGCFPGG